MSPLLQFFGILEKDNSIDSFTVVKGLLPCKLKIAVIVSAWKDISKRFMKCSGQFSLVF